MSIAADKGQDAGGSIGIAGRRAGAYRAGVDKIGIELPAAGQARAEAQIQPPGLGRAADADAQLDVATQPGAIVAQQDVAAGAGFE